MGIPLNRAPWDNQNSSRHGPSSEKLIVKVLGTLSDLIFAVAVIVVVVVLLSVLLVAVTKRSSIHYQSFGH